MGAVLNIALDHLFIYVLDLGVAGAAIATAISQVVSTLVYLFYIFGKKSVFDFKIKNYCLSKEVVSEIFKIGIPTLVFQILTSLSISLINNAAADYGDAAIAGMGVVTRLVSMGKLRVHDWAIFNSDRRYYQRVQETGTYLDELAEDTTQPEVKTVEDFLDSIENQCLYQILIKVDRLTLQIALMKIQGYSTREIAVCLNITEKAVYRRMDRLKEKLKKFFE